jgi:hypothetical protein
MNRFDRHTIQLQDDGKCTVYGWGIYPRSSVLSGQPMKVYLKSFESMEDAKDAYPDATLSNKFLDPQVSLNHLPSENDSVPGGAYPDDYDDDYRD